MAKTWEEVRSTLDFTPEDEAIIEKMKNEIIRKWDPDYTKLTPSQRANLERTENGECVDAKDIKWD
jgi:hypothetical protein